MAVQEIVDTQQSTGGAFHGVFCWGEPKDDLIPRCGAWEDDLYHHSNKVHPTESAAPKVEYLSWSEEPEKNGNNKWKGKVTDAIGQPGNDIKDGVGVAGEEIRYVGPEEDRLESGQ